MCLYDGGSFEVDWVFKGSHESYVRAVLCPAITPVKQGGLGYRGIVVNFRGCAGVPLTSAQLYSAGHTDDIRQGTCACVVGRHN